MRVGITILPEHTWSEAAPRWREADTMGFAHAWTYDHLVWAGLPDSPWFGALPTLTAAATVTERVGLGTFVTSPNYRHPYLLARDLMTLDDVSGGRAIAGLGTGGDRDAHIIGADLPLRERVERFHEFVPLLHRLLGEDHVDHLGAHFTTVDARTLPAPSRAGRIPFVVAADGPRSQRLAARWGQGWLTTGPRGSETLQEWWAGVRELSGRMDDIEAAAGRTEPLDRYLNIDPPVQFALASAEVFAEMVGRAAERGFTDVVTHWPRPQGPYAGDERVLREVARRL